jgi:hypothetical protein
MANKKVQHPPTAFAIAVMVGVVGLTLASGSPGGLSGIAGFFLAFVLTFVALWALLIFLGQRQTDNSHGPETPGRESPAVPRGPIVPVKPSGGMHRNTGTQDKLSGMDEAAQRRGDVRHSDEP